MKCEACRFWRPHAPSEVFIVDGSGGCHRRAPSPVGATQLVILGTIRERGVTLATDHLERTDPVATGGDIWDRQALWPTTMKDDFCGEFVVAKEPVW